MNGINYTILAYVIGLALLVGFVLSLWYVGATLRRRERERDRDGKS